MNKMLCETDPSDVSYKACVEIASVATASSPSMDLLLVSDPGFVTYSSIESRADDSESMELRTQWEPVVTYFYSFDSALDGISAQQYSGQY
jgi:hypothetical protein